MPPKFEIGKDIRVRVLSVNVSKRSLEFTKKDTLMKEDTPVYQGYRELKKGNKVVGVMVSKNEHGYIIRSFGGVKGLLTFTDVEEKLGNDKATTSQGAS
jgi:ribosomal protein S1